MYHRMVKTQNGKGVIGTLAFWEFSYQIFASDNYNIVICDQDSIQYLINNYEEVLELVISE